MSTEHDEDTIEACAIALYEASRAFHAAIMEDCPELSWERVSDKEKILSRSVARSILCGASPEQRHHKWSKHLIKNGWTYAAIYNRPAKVHPFLTPYHVLPPTHRAKDRLQVAVVMAVAQAITECDA